MGGGYARFQCALIKSHFNTGHDILKTASAGRKDLMFGVCSEVLSCSKTHLNDFIPIGAFQDIL